MLIVSMRVVIFYVARLCMFRLDTSTTLHWMDWKNIVVQVEMLGANVTPFISHFFERWQVDDFKKTT